MQINRIFRRFSHRCKRSQVGEPVWRRFPTVRRDQSHRPAPPGQEAKNGHQIEDKQLVAQI